MQKETITFNGVDYVARTVDVTSIPNWEAFYFPEVTVAEHALWEALEPHYPDDEQAEAIDNRIFFYPESDFMRSDPTDEEIVAYLKEKLYDPDAAAHDSCGQVIREGDHVLWHDPETGETTEYEVYQVHSEDLVKLSNDYSECEALPSECTIVSRKSSKNSEDKK